MCKMKIIVCAYSCIMSFENYGQAWFLGNDTHHFSDEYSDCLATDHMQNKIKWGDCQSMFSVINGQNFLHPLPPHGSSTLLDPRGIFVFLYHSVSVIVPSVAITLDAAEAAINCTKLSPARLCALMQTLGSAFLKSHTTGKADKIYLSWQYI